MHLFWLAVVLHIRPVWIVHTEVPPVPHRHSSSLATAPAVCAHVGGGVHLLVAFVHRNPVAAVHTVPPHKQVSVFDVAPLVCVQSDAATHRQKSEFLVHDAVEVGSIL